MKELLKSWLLQAYKVVKNEDFKELKPKESKEPTLQTLKSSRVESPRVATINNI